MNDIARTKPAKRRGRPRRSVHLWAAHGWLDVANALGLDDIQEVRNARAMVAAFGAPCDATGGPKSLVAEPPPPKDLARVVWTECARLGIEMWGLVLASRENVFESTPRGGRRRNGPFRLALQKLHDSVRAALRRQRCEPAHATRIVGLLCMLVTIRGIPLSELRELRVLLRAADGQWLTGVQRLRLLTKRIDQLVA